MIEGMDKSLGDLMAALQRLGIADNTIILFMSDNGAPQMSPRTCRCAATSSPPTKAASASR